MEHATSLRYTRQQILREIGEAGQQKLLGSSILIVGAGGLGCPGALYLAAAGVGHIALIDSDRISVSNLQRQILFGENDLGKNKAFTAVNKLSFAYPHIRFTAFDFKLQAANALEIIKDFDLIIDASDNFPTKYLLSDTCEMLAKPWVHAAVHQWEAQIALFNMEGSATYRDLYPTPPSPENAPNCNTAGVLGALVGMVGSLQALEAIKALLNISPNLRNTLLCIDSISYFFTKLKFKSDQNREKINSLIDYDQFCNYQSEQALDPVTFNSFDPDKYCLIDIRPEEEHERQNLGSINVQEEDLLEYVNLLHTKNTVILYCTSGIRSRKIAESLKKLILDKDIFFLNGTLDDFS
jgi:sulfur-carrier protein adenylyltransferase/sulfurtransferase